MALGRYAFLAPAGIRAGEVSTSHRRSASCSAPWIRATEQFRQSFFCNMPNTPHGCCRAYLGPHHENYLLRTVGVDSETAVPLGLEVRLPVCPRSGSPFSTQSCHVMVAHGLYVQSKQAQSGTAWAVPTCCVAPGCPLGCCPDLTLPHEPELSWADILPARWRSASAAASAAAGRSPASTGRASASRTPAAAACCARRSCRSGPAGQAPHIAPSPWPGHLESLVTVDQDEPLRK